MNIPVRPGQYEIKIGQNTFSIDIHYEHRSQSRMDLIGTHSVIGGYKLVLIYSVGVNDNNGNYVDSISTDSKEEYISFIAKFMAEENGTSIDPAKILEKLYFKFQQETDLYIASSKFNGIVKGMVKLTFCVSDDSKHGKYDPSIISSYFEGLGLTCKIADKKKNVRTMSCYVVSVFVPFDFTLNESRKKETTISEARLIKIIKETVSKVMKDILA